jgi:hypothetical protein
MGSTDYFYKAIIFQIPIINNMMACVEEYKYYLL